MTVSHTGPRIAAVVASMGFTAMATSPAFAGAHTWRINEIYSSSDGSVQFIELLETCGGSTETSLSGHQVTSLANSVNLVDLPPNSSSNKHLLLATANLPSLGGPTPDYIIPANFFSLTGDTISYTPYHSCVIASGSVPTDGTNSIHRPAGCGGGTCLSTTDINSPTNFSGDSGSVTLPPDCSGVSDCSGNGTCIEDDVCDCDSGWTGADCGTFTCSGVDDCSGQGTCVGPNTCACDEGFGGANCTVAIPAVSQWGLFVLGLVLLVAATMAIRRKICTVDRTPA